MIYLFIYFIYKIKNKLKRQASELISGQNFAKWTDLKTFLLNNYDDKQNIQTIVRNICQAPQNKTTTFEFLKDVQEKYNRVKAKVNLSHIKVEAKTAVNALIQSIAV